MRRLALKSASILYKKCLILLIVGDKEVENNHVAVRTREGKDLGVMTIDTICDTVDVKKLPVKGVILINHLED